LQDDLAIMRHITFLLLNGMLATSATLPMEQLRAAEHDYRAKTKKRRQMIDLSLCADSRAAVETHTAIALLPHVDISDDHRPDIVFVPALWRNPMPLIRNQARTCRWLRSVANAGATIVGVGTGCCLIAEAGLLDHKAATTHWHYFDQFAARYPAVRLKRSHFITHDENIYCTASVNALAELTVYFIAKLFDADTARRVERQFFHDVRFARTASMLEGGTDAHPDEAIAEAQSWLRDHAAQPVNIATLAKNAGMSQRTFNRRFLSATGATPVKYLQRMRLDLACELLQETNLSQQEIAFRIGYHDSDYLTSLFKREFSITPGEYRTTVRAKLFK